MIETYTKKMKVRTAILAAATVSIAALGVVGQASAEDLSATPAVSLSTPPGVLFGGATVFLDVNGQTLADETIDHGTNLTMELGGNIELGSVTSGEWAKCKTGSPVNSELITKLDPGGSLTASIWYNPVDEDGNVILGTDGKAIRTYVFGPETQALPSSGQAPSATMGLCVRKVLK